MLTKALVDAFTSMFSARQMYQFALGLCEAPGLVADIPTPEGAVPSDYAWNMLLTLDRRGLLGTNFVQEWMRQRPARREEVWAAAYGRPLARSEGQIHNLPFAADRFVGRDADWSRIDEALQPANHPNRGTPIAICGIPGIGKTYLAVRWAMANRESYRSVCWVDARAAQIEESLASLARVPLGLPIPEGSSGSDVARLVHKELVSGGPYLVILDDVEAPEDSWRFRAAEACTVIVTSKRRDLQCPRTVVLLAVDRESSFRLMQREPGDAPEPIEDLRRLGERLEWHTLSMSLAGRLLAQPGQTAERLLRRLDQAGLVRWSESLPEDLETGKVGNLGVLFEASVELLDPCSEVDETALLTFKVAGLLPTGPLDSGVIFGTLRRLLPSTSGAVFDDARLRLAAIGLVDLDRRLCVSLHAITAAYATHIAGEEVRRAVEYQLRLGDGSVTPARSDSAAIVGSVPAITTTIPGPRQIVESPTVLLRAALALLANGDSQQSKDLLSAALNALVRELGEWSDIVALYRVALGRVMVVLGYGTAGRDQMRVGLSVLTQLWGPLSPGLIPAYMDLADAERIMGHPEVGVRHLRRAREIARRRLGEDSVATLVTSQRLAYLLRLAREHAVARAVLESSVQVAEASRGSIDTLTADLKSDLGWLRLVEGRPGEAAALHKSAAPVFESAYGGDSAIARFERFQLGRALDLSGDRAGRTIMEEEIDSLQRVWGSDSPAINALRSWIE